MQKCSSCGADLPENSRFCGKCGSAQYSISTGAAATVNNTPQPQFWMPEGGTLAATWSPSSNDPSQGSAPAWSPNVQAPATPPLPPVDENEDERRRGIPLWSPLYGAALAGDALLGSGQASTPGAPVVQGTPQIGNVPGVTGSPTPYTNVPISQPMQGAGNVPVSHPTPISYPVQGTGNVPVSHPIPISHPVQGPQSTPQPPERPEAPGHHPPHKPHRHHTHPLQHDPHRVVKAKVAGGSTVKTIIIVVTAVVVAAAGVVGAAAHFLSHPQPIISITSNYTAGNTPAGANGTILHIGGQNFSSNSAITLLLDGHIAPGNPGTQSDSNGNFSTDMTITNAWSVGTHTLTARDASNDGPKNIVSVTIVQPGQANTPGPNGAPPDDASFTLKVTTEPDIANPFSSNPVLIITGHPDPEGGTVCSPDDNGQSFTQNDTTPNTGMPFTRVDTATCSGTYKAGQISYTETSTSVKVSSQSNGVNVTCVLPNPTVDLRLTGAYAGNNTFRGKINSPYFAYTCDQPGWSWWHEASQGVTWTGTIVKQ